MCFALAAKAGWSAEQQRKLAAGLADELAAIGRAADAAELTLQYLQNVDTAGDTGWRAGRQQSLPCSTMFCHVLPCFVTLCHAARLVLPLPVRAQMHLQLHQSHRCLACRPHVLHSPVNWVCCYLHLACTLPAPG
jgi:hypothetical protein